MGPNAEDCEKRIKRLKNTLNLISHLTLILAKQGTDGEPNKAKANFPVYVCRRKLNHDHDENSYFKELLMKSTGPDKI